VALKTIPPKAVILAAGRGERLRPPTDGLPKPMLPTTVRVVPPAGMKIGSVVIHGDAYAADSEIALVLEHDWTLESEPCPA